MLYLALQMFIFLLLAFLGGLVLGWLIWGRHFLGMSGGNVQARRVTKTILSADDQEAMERLRNELEETRRRRDELKVRNDSLRQQLQESANTTTAIATTATMEGSFAEDLKDDAVTEILRKQNEEYAHEINALRAELSEYEPVDELKTLDSLAGLTPSSLDDVKDDAKNDTKNNAKKGHHENEPFLQNEAATNARQNTSEDDDFADDDALLPNYSSAVTETVTDPGQDSDSAIAAETTSDAEPDSETDEEESALDEFVQNNRSHKLQADEDEDEDDFEDDGIPVITSFINMDTHEEDPRTPGLKPRDEVHREVEDAADKTTDDGNYFAAEDSFTEDPEIPSAAMPANTSIQPEQSDSEDLLPKHAHNEPVEPGKFNEPETAVAPADQSASPGIAPELLRGPIGTADDLKKISGIGSKLERVLNNIGIYHFWQIAELFQGEVDWLNDQIALPGHIERKNWISQAAELAPSRQAEFSLRHTDSDS